MSAASISDCMRAVEARCGVTTLDLLSDRRAREIARPRQIVMWLARQTTYHSLPVIARHLRRSDHTTVLHGIRMIDRLRLEHDGIRAITDDLKAQLLKGEWHSPARTARVVPTQG